MIRTKQEAEELMDSIGYGNPSLESIEATAKEIGATSIRVFATVAFLNPNDVVEFEANAKEDMTAQIEQAANGREYVARYWAMAFTSDQTSAPAEH